MSNEEDEILIEEYSEEEIEQDTSKNTLTKVLSFPWKDISHVVIGPRGVSLVPTGLKAKYPYPSKSVTPAYPQPGSEQSGVFEYDVHDLVGAVEKLSELESVLEKQTSELEALRKTVQNIKEEEEKKKKEEENKSSEEEKKKKKDDKKEECSTQKEAEVQKEKEEASTKEDTLNTVAPTRETEDHESNITKIAKLMKLAKEKNVL